MSDRVLLLRFIMAWFSIAENDGDQSSLASVSSASSQYSGPGTSVDAPLRLVDVQHDDAAMLIARTHRSPIEMCYAYTCIV